MTLNDYNSQSYPYENNYQAIQKLKKYTEENKNFFGDKEDNYVEGGYNGVQKRSETLSKIAEQKAKEKIAIKLEEKIEFYNKKNEIENNLNKAFFKLKTNKIEEGMCPGGCGYPYEHCHC